MTGFLVVDKPVGMTSHDVVARVRRSLKVRKVGHTGTLDPFATGVLPIAVGEGTKAIPYLDEREKRYEATLLLGVSTETLDATGAVTEQRGVAGLAESMVRDAVLRFVGEIVQVPPMYSALKKNGVPLYRLARKGEVVEREPRTVTIHALTIEEVSLPFVRFSVRCSRGTYIRSLAADIGAALGCGGHLTALRRVASGPFSIEETISVQELDDPGIGSSLLPLEAVLTSLPSLDLSEDQVGAVQRGIDIPPLEETPDGPVLLTSRGMVVAIGRRVAGGGIHPERVFTSFSFT